MRLGFVLALIIPLWSLAQERCATDHILINRNRTETHEQFAEWVNDKIEQKKASRRLFEGRSAQSIYTIPVVFHIIHNGEDVGSGLNISEDHILDQVNILNEDYRRQNPDKDNTPEEYLSVAADTEIQFILAKQDPEGIPSNGITRTEGSLEVYTDNQGPLLTSLIQWPPEDYLNIYVTDLKDVLGFAVFPFTDLGGLSSLYKNIAENEGIFIDYKYVGYNDDPSIEFESFGRTVTHEIGHYLGVLHTFEGTCSGGGDYCSDTPVQSNSSLGRCETPNINTCDEEIRPMIENYMDYTDDACMNLFTNCQKTRMRTVLENSPRRKSLLTSHALEDPIVVANDLGIRNINAPLKSDCFSDFTPSVQVRNYGSNTISNFKVRVLINGQELETASFNISLGPLAMSNVSFLTPQSIETDSAFTVSFEIAEVNGGTDGNILNDSKSIQINPTNTAIAPYTLNFDASGYIITETDSETSSQWSVTTAPNTEALNQAAKFPCFNNPSAYGSKDMLLSTPLDLWSLTSALLTFNYAYSGRSSDEYLDALIVGISTDCGATFHYEDYLFSRSGNDLVTTSKTNFEFTPSSTSDWEQVDLNITQYLGMGEIQFAFIGVNGGGNNIYIDDIEVSSANLPAYDLGLRRLENASILTCRDDLTPVLNIRNYGYEEIDRLELKVTVNGVESTETYNNLNMQSGQSDELNFEFLNLPLGENNIEFEVVSVNNDLMDSFSVNNLLKYHVLIDQNEDVIPVKETFDLDTLQFAINEINNEPIFEVVPFGRNNNVLRSNSYDSGIVGSETYLVTSSFKTLDYETAAIRFKLSYASRKNYVDNLKVLLSTNCGRDYNLEIYNENLADITTQVSDTKWVPEDESDWETVFIDISDHLIWPELRAAFVFTNGQGNHLYLDDVEVLTSSDTSQIAFSNRFTFYPNPVEDHFYMSFNLPRKQTVYFQLIDMTGNLIINHAYPNTLNQRYEVLVPNQSGFYLIRIQSKDVNRVERLFIR